MTALGKLGVLVVFILSLAWFGLTVNLFVTRNNWKADAQKAAKNATELEQANKTLIEQLKRERDRFEEGIQSITADRDRLQTQLNDANDQYKALIQSYDKKLASERKEDVAQTEAIALQKKLQDEIDNKTALVKKLEADLDARLKSEELARNNESNAVREASVQKNRAEKFADDLRKATELIAELKSSGATVTNNVRPIAPEGFRGTVRDVSRTGEFVEFTPGSNSGLRPNTKLTIFRPAAGLGEAKFIGYVVVSDQVDPDRSVGSFELPVSVKKPKPEDLPQKGDILIPTNSGR